MLPPRPVVPCSSREPSRRAATHHSTPAAPSETRPSARAWGLPVQTVPAGDVEPGDVLFGPGLVRGVRIWWALRSGDDVELLLPDGEGRLVRTRHHAASVLVIGPRTADVGPRLLAAACGAVTLRVQRHPHAPPVDALDALVRAHAVLSGLAEEGSWSLVRSGVAGTSTSDPARR